MPRRIPDKHGVFVFKEFDLLFKQPVIGCQTGQKDESRSGKSGCLADPVMDGPAWTCKRFFFHNRKFKSKDVSKPLIVLSIIRQVRSIAEQRTDRDQSRGKLRFHFALKMPASIGSGIIQAKKGGKLYMACPGKHIHRGSLA